MTMAIAMINERGLTLDSVRFVLLRALRWNYPLIASPLSSLSDNEFATAIEEFSGK